MNDQAKTSTPGERIAKMMARAGVASRREAEAWIAQGRVAVNGKVITSPALNVTARDRIAVDGAPLPLRERTRLFLYYKPVGLVTTHADPAGRPTLFAALPPGLPRLVSVGRLDLNTEGLLLLTNDGGLARVLELPSTGWLRRYRVRAHGRVQQDMLDKLRDGITIDGVRYGGIEATIDRQQGSNVWLTFAMREGKNREVKNVLGHLGLAVNRLIRVSYGPFQLTGLEEGQIEEVKTRVLREQLGERIAVQSGADFSSPIRDITRPPAHHDDRTKSPAPRDDRRGEARPPRGASPAAGEPRDGRRAEFDRVKVDRVKGDRVRGDRVKGDRLKGVWAKGDRTKGDRAKDDRANDRGGQRQERQDHQRQNRPWQDRPRQDRQQDRQPDRSVRDFAGKAAVRPDKPKRRGPGRSAAERFGEPELARREKRNRKRFGAGKSAPRKRP